MLRSFLHFTEIFNNTFNSDVSINILSIYLISYNYIPQYPSRMPSLTVIFSETPLIIKGYILSFL